MEAAAKPNDESGRVKSLYAANVLDTPPEQRFDRLVRIAKRMFDVPIAVISLVDADCVWFKSCSGLSVAEINRDSSFCGHTILTDALFVIEDTLKDRRFADNPLVVNAPHIRFYAGFPFSVDSEYRIGSFCILDDKPRQFSDEDAQLLADMTDVLERELMALRIGSIDELTGINNRRGFHTIGQLFLNKIGNNTEEASLLFIDLDKFKAINDAHGHSSGDAALQYFTKVLQSHTRKADVLSRYGGDEFVVLMPETTAKEAQYIANRIESEIAAADLQHDWRNKLAFSFGVVGFLPGKQKSLHALLEEADKLMYKSKALGS